MSDLHNKIKTSEDLINFCKKNLKYCKAEKKLVFNILGLIQKGRPKRVQRGKKTDEEDLEDLLSDISREERMLRYMKEQQEIANSPTMISSGGGYKKKKVIKKKAKKVN